MFGFETTYRMIIEQKELFIQLSLGWTTFKMILNVNMNLHLKYFCCVFTIEVPVGEDICGTIARQLTNCDICE